MFRRAIGKLLACAIGGVLLASSTALAAAPHTVEPGETLWSIALANNLTTRALAAANGLPAEAQTVQELASLNDLDPTGTLLIGTRLRLPTGAPAAPPAAVHPPGSPLVRNVLACYQSRCTVEVLRGQARDDP